MAQTFLAAAMGAAANDGSGAKIREGGLLIAADLEDLYTQVAALAAASVTAADIVRSDASVAATGAAGQVIPFSSQFVTGYALTIIDPLGLGVEVTASDEDGFTIHAGTAGNFGYIAIVEI